MGKVFKWLSILGRLGNIYVDQQLREWKINSSHHMFLIHICEEPGITQDRLKTVTHVHPSNVTRALEYLEREDYITKTPLETDKRTSRLYPTEKAELVCNHIICVVEQWEERLETGMTEEEVQTMSRLLECAGKEAINYLSNR